MDNIDPGGVEMTPQNTKSVRPSGPSTKTAYAGFDQINEPKPSENITYNGIFNSEVQK